MPRIINAYDGNSALGDSLAKLGESIYGDQAKNEVYRQKAFGQKNINDLVTDAGVGLDDPRLAKAQLGIGGTAAGTFPGQGRALANDRWTNAATNAAGERNNVRNNAETHYGTDRRYDSDIATTGMNNTTTLAAEDMRSKRAADTQLAIDGRTLAPISDGHGGYIYSTKSQAPGQGAPMTTDQVKAGVISQALQRHAAEMQQQNSPFTTGAPSWNAGGSAPQPAPQQPAQRGGGVSAGAFTGLTPQELALIGQKEQPMIHPGTGQTGTSWDNGSTLASGQPATGYAKATDADVLRREGDNTVRQSVGQPLPPRPEGYSPYAMDAGHAAGLDSVAQKVANEVSGIFNGPEIGAGYNSARNNLNNTNQLVNQLMESAPGTKAAVAREKAANRLLPTPNFFGMTGMSGDTQKHQADDVIGALRDRYALVQSEAMDQAVQPAERAVMQQWLHRTSLALAHLEGRDSAAPTAGAQPAATPQAAAPAQAAPTAGAPPDLPTLSPEQAMALAPGTPFRTMDGRVKYR
jgi:hypothetical protein